MDITYLIETAKATILEQGDHPPLLFAECKSGSVHPYSVEFVGDKDNTTHHKQVMLFGVGREHGIAHPGNPVISLALISEAWLSITRGEKPKYSIPHEDPNKMEVLIILQLDCSTATLKSTQTTVEMLRDGSGALVDLLTLRPMDEVHDHLLPYFLAGTISAKMSDAELMRMLTGQKD